MAKLVFGMNVSLDGYVDHDRFGPDAVLFRHFVEDMRALAGSVYGRRMYELMRYWDEDDAGWSADERDFALAWRAQPKWVVSSTLTSVGPNATVLGEDYAAAIGRLRTELDGKIEVAGPVLASRLTELGLIDVYELYVHPVALGHGSPYFVGPAPALRLLDNERIGDSTVRLTYAPA